MPTIFSKFARILSFDPQPVSERGPDTKPKLHTQLPSSDERLMTQAEMKKLNPGSASSEVLPESSQSAEKQPDMTQSKSDDWKDKKAGLTLGNGQLRLKIENWKSTGPTFTVENNPKGNPKCNLQGFVEGPELIYIDFTIPTNHPGGMMGVMQSIEALFMFPSKVAIKSMEPGSAASDRESNNPKRGRHYIDWTSPWDTSGCRVSWMRTKKKSPIIKFKFVSGRNAKRQEQMIVSVDEREPSYRVISKNDPVSIQDLPSLLGFN